jgi:FtsZ-interacting cell division protein ZipA
MSWEVIVGAVLFVVVVSLALWPKRKPKEKYFTCARCKAVSLHSARSIEAWRNNKTSFYCSTCHKKWLNSQPQHVRHQPKQAAGCLSVIIVMVLPALLIGGIYWLV